MPILKNNERLYVYLQGNHFQQNNVLTSNNDNVINKNVVNIYIVYKLDPLASTRDKSYTIQNALFGAIKVLIMLLIMIKIIIKDMVYILMKEVSLVIQYLKVVMLIKQTLETF